MGNQLLWGLPMLKGYLPWTSIPSSDKYLEILVVASYHRNQEIRLISVLVFLVTIGANFNSFTLCMPNRWILSYNHYKNKNVNHENKYDFFWIFGCTGRLSYNLVNLSIKIESCRIQLT